MHPRLPRAYMSADFFFVYISNHVELESADICIFVLFFRAGEK